MRLVEREGVRSTPIYVTEETREDFTVFEQTSKNQFRFVLPGSPLAEREWRACLSILETIEEMPPYLVCSGSLPPEVPDDFYGCAARIAKARGSKCILDTSGAPLAAALKEGVFLVKPNLRELQELTQVPLANRNEQIRATRGLIEVGATEHVALTLGDKGAVLVSRDAAYFAQAPGIKPVSAVGAGDSFLGGMAWSLAAGHSIIEAFRWGVAAGSAAVLNPGTELCHVRDVIRLHEQIKLDSA